MSREELIIKRERIIIIAAKVHTNQQIVSFQFKIAKLKKQKCIFIDINIRSAYIVDRYSFLYLITYFTFSFISGRVNNHYTIVIYTITSFIIFKFE